MLVGCADLLQPAYLTRNDILAVRGKWKMAGTVYLWSDGDPSCESRIQVRHCKIRTCENSISSS
jgi:hypothetical protein